MPIRQPRRAGILLETGQTTQYNSELDDGYYEVGLNKRYSVLTLGQYSGMSNIDLAHFSDNDLTFARVAATFDTITSAAGDLGALYNPDDIIVCTGAGEAGNNDTAFTLVHASAGVISCATTTTLTDEAASATVSIAKREALSNNCVQDLVTGRMWARYTSAENAKMGAASDGKMKWTGELYDIFQWAAAANAASLGGPGGYSDWRISNDVELANLRNVQATTAVPDTTAFPGWPAEYIWTSTTLPTDSSSANIVHFLFAQLATNPKGTVYFAALVRGGL